VLVVGASSLAACGGGSGSASSSDTDTSTSTAAASTAAGGAGANGTSSAAFTKYAACLKKNGVDLPAGGPGGPGTGNGPPSTDGGANGAPPAPGGDRAKFQKAQQACASLQPAGANGGFPGAGGDNNAATAAFRNCLTINGVKDGTARTSEKFKKATAACASLLPKRGTPPTTTTGSS
jgi:hypothetical protein